jgi:glycerophosphoryl diester phosphodiesterase
MGFAHRGLHGPGIPENSLAAFRSALEIGAGIECDVRLSGDNQVMVFHDHDLRRLCASALAVESTSAAALASQKLFDSREHIPRLRELLDLVEGRVPILIEVKSRGENAAQLTRAVADELKNYGGPIGVMSFEPSVGKWLKNHEPGICRGLVISGRAGAFDRWRSIKSASPDFVAIDFTALARPWVKNLRRSAWVYSWTIRAIGQRQTAEVHADALIWEGDGRPRT